MSTRSIAVIPPQPDAAQYPISALYLFREYSRQTYQQATGKQAPPFDPSRPPKGWWDDAATGAPYLVAHGGGVMELSIPKDQARTVNLPGAYTYPAWTEPDPTTATTAGGGALNPVWLSEVNDAAALAAEINDQLGLGVSLELAQGYVYPAHETRRVWLVRGMAAGLLLQARNKQSGVGAPGRWVLQDDGLSWHPETQATGNGRGWLPVPIRPLADNERLELQALGGSVVVRTDKAEPAAGGYTAQDRARDDKAARQIAAMARVLGVVEVS